MKISYTWLKELLDPGQSPADLAYTLTMLGLETASFEQIGGLKSDLAGVVVGKVLSVEKHPNADRLRICQVDLGGDSPVPIVCGAANVAAGQKVPVATPGAVLHPWGKDESEAFAIKESKIRGERSLGMICAEDELGLGPGHEGILVLPEETPVGIPFRDTLRLNPDYVFEVELTPNRVDAASHYGVARDLGAALGKSASLPSPILPPQGRNFPNPIPVSIEDPQRCRRYTAIYIEGVRVAESPAWIQDRLKAIGLRPINNVVDITNLVLHELGHPLHAFDADLLKGRQIRVRTLAAPAAFETLDKVSRAMEPGSDLMICDAEDPLCIAGVMGGLHSGVSDQTRNVFLESAWFDPVSVRKTARRLGLSTDSSFRFERGADPAMTLTAALRAAALIVEVAGGRASDAADWGETEFPPRELAFSVSKFQRIAGKAIPRETILRILDGLEIAAEGEGDLLQLRVPPYRVDVTRDVDVMEDLLRVYGYNQVEIPARLSYTLPFRQYRDLFRMRQNLANFLSAAGFYEIMNNSLQARKWGDERAVAILNPLSEDLAIMRQSLLPGLLESIRYNQNRQQEDLALYEFGKTYQLAVGGGYEEQEWLALALTGGQHPMHWERKSPPSSFRTIAREAERLRAWLGFEGELRESDWPEFDYGLEMLHAGRFVFRYGKVSAALGEAFDLRNEVFVLLADWQALADLQGAPITYREVPLYPGQRRDLSLLLDAGLSFEAIRKLLPPQAPELLRSVALHDVYMGQGIPEGKKSYLISVELRDEAQTLDDRRADEAMKRIRQALEEKLGAEIRQ